MSARVAMETDGGEKRLMGVSFRDASKVLAAAVSSTDGPRLSLVQESSVLPALAVKHEAL